MVFKDRTHAGKLLAEALKNYKNNENAVVLGIPRGGVVIGYELARYLNLPLEIELVKKIEHPLSPELAIGAVSLKGRIVGTDYAGPMKKYIEEQTQSIREMLAARYKMFKRKPLNWQGKTVIITDDGIATGSTMIALIQLIKQDEPQKIIVAVPVAPKRGVKAIQAYADEVICLMTPDDFYAISEFYESFSQVSDEEVIQLLRKAEQNFRIQKGIQREKEDVEKYHPKNKDFLTSEH
ncbi:MAG: phosphoribosyltransferase [Chitinophagales bacterium]|nr:MAG: phosphoribosyltransferase [Chitinophagales bacterium]